MLQSIKKRGPDSEASSSFKRLCFGYRRLAIIDPEHGQQPFISQNGNIIVFYNGEIYNFLELRAQLSDKYTFISNSDGEIIAHGFAEWGEQVFSKLNGDFAISILDKRNNTLFLARDRFGIKPLYYHEKNGNFLFCSEIKGILSNPLCKTRIRRNSIAEFLSLLYPLYPESFFENIYSLPPACVMKISIQTLEKNIFSYWNFPEVINNISLEQASEHFSELINDSVRLRLQSDVPLGSFLSGGLDSSTICSIAGERVSDYYTAFFPDFPEYSEFALAGKIASQFGGEHHITEITPEGIISIIHDATRAYEAPHTGPVGYFIHLISQDASNKVRVLLDGNGGDELLAGYPRYNMITDKSCFAHDSNKYSEKINSLSQDISKELIIKGFKESPISSYFRINHMISSFELPLFLKKEFLIDISSEFEERFSPSNGIPFINNLQRFDFSNSLLSLLMIQDKITMANSIENRVPFLDYRLVDFVFSLSDKLKIDKSKGKILLRKAMEKILPEEFFSAPKVGTPRPDREWFSKGPLNNFAKDILFDDKHPMYYFIKKDGVRKIFLDHIEGRKNFSQRLWVFLNLGIFLEEYKNWI